jgi:hypothetical protein
MSLWVLQHRFVHYRDDSPNTPRSLHLKVIADDLNVGWEIVSATPVADALGNIKTVVYVLKRDEGREGDPR